MVWWWQRDETSNDDNSSAVRTMRWRKKVWSVVGNLLQLVLLSQRCPTPTLRAILTSWINSLFFGNQRDEVLLLICSIQLQKMRALSHALLPCSFVYGARCLFLFLWTRNSSTEFGQSSVGPWGLFTHIGHALSMFVCIIVNSMYYSIILSLSIYKLSEMKMWDGLLVNILI